LLAEETQQQTVVSWSLWKLSVDV